MPKKQITFEEGMASIDKNIAALEGGVALEDSIKHYEEAMEMVGHCRKCIESVEGKAKKVVDKHTGATEELKIEE